ncbi:MAG: hypothetical protein HYY93_07850 [Planctomycetes bacterium]|nr:hypothetical protein [Planctomycetota bacterium]
MTEDSSRPIESISGCLIRVVWLFLGPALAFLMAALLAVDAKRLGSAGDMAFAAIVGATIAARLLDDPQARPSRPVFAVAAAVLGGGLWALGRFISG